MSLFKRYELNNFITFTACIVLFLLSGITFMGQFIMIVFVTVLTPHIREQLFEKYRTEKVHQIRRRITVLGLGMVAVVGVSFYVFGRVVAFSTGMIINVLITSYLIIVYK